MYALTSALLVLTLLLTGAYAGLTLMCQIGVLPAMRRLSLSAYANAWRAMDAHLDRSMPPYKISLLLINAATIVCLAVEHRIVLMWAASLSFLLSLTGLVLTIRFQLPLNSQLKTLAAGGPDEVLLYIREKTVRNFSVRFALAAAAFVILSVAVVVWPGRSVGGWK